MCAAHQSSFVHFKERKKEKEMLNFKKILRCYKCIAKHCQTYKTLQELRMLSSVTLNCQVTKIVIDSGSQLSEL